MARGSASRVRRRMIKKGMKKAVADQTGRTFQTPEHHGILREKVKEKLAELDLKIDEKMNEKQRLEPYLE